MHRYLHEEPVLAVSRVQLVYFPFLPVSYIYRTYCSMVRDNPWGWFGSSAFNVLTCLT